ncbi:mabiki [Cochliomyia hominivorax]
MSSFTPNHSIMEEETFEYHHKKFDQNKRLRKNSSGSSNGDYECIKVEIERINEESPQQRNQETNKNFKYSAPETNCKRSFSPNTQGNSYTDTLILPEPKRPRSSSFGSSSSYTSSNASYSPLPFIYQPTTTSASKHPSQALSLPATATVLPKISDDTLRSICKYHGNMVRKFPKKERSPKDQERRNKNTIACRMSRRVKKLEHIAIEEQYKEFTQQTFDIIEQSMRATAYLHELMKLSPETEKEHKPTTLMTSSGQQKKPFTIAYLMGREE